MQSTFYVGLDLGSSFCYQTVINADGAPQRARVVPTSEQHLRNAFADLRGDVHVHLEAGELSAWVHSIITPLVSEVVVSHPRSLAWIGKDAVKDDPIDARKLAELLRFNLVHAVYCEADCSRQTFKQLVVHYEDLSREQARLKSKIKARLRTFGIIRKDGQLFSAGGQTALLAEIKEPIVKLMLAQSFAVLNQMITALNEARRAMRDFAAQFAEANYCKPRRVSALLRLAGLSLICKLREGFPTNANCGDIAGSASRAGSPTASD
jgi:transposase